MKCGLLVALSAGMVSSGCFDAVQVAPAMALRVPVAHGAVRVAIQQDSLEAADRTITFVVRIMARDVAVSSYQGVVTFAPGAFDLISVKTPEGQSGEARVLNPSAFADGRIRFAGLATTRFTGVDRGDGVEAFRFTVHAFRPIAEARLLATLDVVGTETGTQVAAERVLSSPGVMSPTRRSIR